MPLSMQSRFGARSNARSDELMKSFCPLTLLCGWQFRQLFVQNIS